MRWASPGFHKLTRFVLRTPEQGADTIVWLAAASEAARHTGNEQQRKHLIKELGLLAL